MRTLAEIVMTPWLHQQTKHDLGSNYAERQINSMSNHELLHTLSNAIEERLEAAMPKDDEAVKKIRFAARAEAFADAMALIGARATYEELIDWLQTEHKAASEGKTREQWEEEL